MPEDLHIETRIAMEDNALELGVTKLGSPSLYTCPECHGVLLQLRTGDLLRFRCHTGHAFTAEALVAHAADAIEESLWRTLRAMEEHLLLLRQIADQLHAAGKAVPAERLRDQARDVERQTQAIRQVVLQHAPLATTQPADTGRIGGP